MQNSSNAREDLWLARALFTAAVSSMMAGCSASAAPEANATSTQGLTSTSPISGYAGKCLDDSGGGTANGNKIQLWDCNGTAAQRWTTDGTILTGPGGKCLDVQSNNQANGTLVQLYDCNGTDAQKWSFTGGAIVSAGGFCLDVTDFGTANGTQLQIWSCTGGPNQQWAMAPGTSPPVVPPPQGGFAVRNGQIYAPDGSVFIARGLNVYDGSQGSVSTNDAGQPLTTLFPGVNFIRLATFDYYDPSYFQTFVQQMSALHIVVEIEHHSGAGGGVAPLTGQALTDESSWFATLAGAFKGNPYVWFGTLNEPAGPGSDLTAEQVSNYNAIRGAGNGSIIMTEVLGDYATGSLVVGAGHGLIASSYSAMTNIVWDFHYYNWLSGYAADVGTNANVLSRYLQQTQTITSADGTVPVVIGEYGVSTDGSHDDAGGTATCIAVQQSGFGSAAWNWYSYAPTDNLTDGNNNLTSYGQQVSSFINGR